LRRLGEGLINMANRITAVYQELKSKLVGEPPEEGPDKLQLQYFEVFNTLQGKAVLADMLDDLHVFDALATDEDATLNTYGKLLLSKIGIIQGDNVGEIVNSLMGVAQRETIRQG
jgi:hypothetical protein